MAVSILSSYFLLKDHSHWLHSAWSEAKSCLQPIQKVIICVIHGTTKLFLIVSEPPSVTESRFITYACERKCVTSPKGFAKKQERRFHGAAV
jgi:hypothetical protein